MLNAIALYWLAGVAFFMLEMYQGGAKHLAELTRRESQGVPPALLPLAAFVVALFLLLVLAIMAFGWPYWAWDDYRRGILFRADRWSE